MELDAKEETLRILDPKNMRQMARRRNRLVYNLRRAGVPWRIIQKIIRRSESSVRYYCKEGEMEAKALNNPFVFMSSRLRNKLKKAGFNIDNPAKFTDLVKAGNRLAAFFVGIGEGSIREIAQCHTEMNYAVSDRHSDHRLAARLLRRSSGSRR